MPKPEQPGEHDPQGLPASQSSAPERGRPGTARHVRRGLSGKRPGAPSGPDRALGEPHRHPLQSRKRGPGDGSVGPQGPVRGTRESRPGSGIRRRLGTGNACALVYGRGTAIAETAIGSSGNAMAIADGSGASHAAVGERARGSVYAWSGYCGRAEAFTGADSSGSASASATGAGAASAKVVRGSAGNAVAMCLGKGSAIASVCEAGDLYVENLGPGSVEVRNFGKGELSVTYQGPRDLVLTSRCAEALHMHVDRHGEVTLHRISATRPQILPAGVGEVLVDRQGRVLFRK